MVLSEHTELYLLVGLTWWLACLPMTSWRNRLNWLLHCFLLANRQHVWLGGVMVTASDLHSTGRGFDSQPFHYQVATLDKLFTHMCLCHQAVQFGTGQRAVMLCGREGNRRPGVALAMRHRHQWFIHIRAQRLWEGDELMLRMGMVDFTFTFT